ncbi:spore germination protein GerPE [Paenibacillus aestuarii]|uniref:Spore germination protein GerPE n=1 Tax=Paenibacillus aestuarii TaxID=516965 RepID=A0ABW0KDA1_9BACL|nr:spore germination protein GerPE [Paenibacillus aestuarii]
MARISIVDSVDINGISSSSILHIGDHVRTELHTQALAVQREIPYFYGNEGNFDVYPFFRRPFPVPQPPEPVQMTVNNWGSFICVGPVRILGVSSSALFQIGSNVTSQSETRIKHFRQSVTNKPGPKQQTTFVKLGDDVGVGDFEDALHPPRPPRPPR